MEAVHRLALRALVASALVIALPRGARAETVRDPMSGVAFWAPDGWTSHTEATATTRLLKRTSPDGRTVVGLLVGEIPGGTSAVIQALESHWKAEGVVAEALDARAGASGAPMPKYRLRIGDRTLIAYTT